MDEAGPAFAFTGDDGGTGTSFYKVAGASGAHALTVVKGGSYYGGVYIAEVDDLGTSTRDVGRGCRGRHRRPELPVRYSSAEADIAVFAAFVQAARAALPYTSGSGYTLLDEVAVFAGGPTGMIEWQSITGATGTQTSTATSTTEHGYGWGMMSFLSRTISYWELAPEATDFDNATYHAVAGASDDGFLLRVELEDAYAISSVTLLIGFSAAGAKTLDLYGATLADFSDEVMLDTVSMTATGTYAPDTVSFGFVPSETYQYYRIAGSGACRIFTLSMYERIDRGRPDRPHHGRDGRARRLGHLDPRHGRLLHVDRRRGRPGGDRRGRLQRRPGRRARHRRRHRSHGDGRRLGGAHL